MNHIGEDIRRARIAKNLSIEDVASETKISATVIRDIENGKFDLYYGDEPYVRMYIKKISEVLNVDGYELTQQYDHLSGLIKKELQDKEETKTVTAIKHVNFEKPNYARNPSVYEDKSHITLIRSVIILTLIFALVGVIWFAIASTSKDDTQFKDPNSTVVDGNVPVKQEEETNKEEKPKEEVKAEITKVADYDYKFKVNSETDSFVVRIEFMKKSWTSVFMNKNGKLFEGFEVRNYGPKSAGVIAQYADAVKKHNEANPHYTIEQREDMEIVEFTFKTAEFEELIIRSGNSKDHHYYINGVEIILGDSEKVEGTKDLHLAIEKES